MIELKFAYRGQPICLVAPNEHDSIPTKIQLFGTFYELDVLERCEFYVRRLRHTEGIIIDIGAYIGNHTVYFANFCQAEQVIALEASKLSYDLLTQTISRNRLKNVRACNLAVGARNDWGTIVICDPGNLGANRVEPCIQNRPDAVRIIPLDMFLKSIGCEQARVSLMKIDVEGMESEVMEGAKQSIARSRPILCVEVLDGPHMGKMMERLKGSSYLIRECTGAAPTYLVTWEARIPRLLIRAINYGWLLLAHYGNDAMRWYYQRVIEEALPV